MNEIYLMATEPLPSNDWQVFTENYLNSVGFCTVKHKNQLIVWKEKNCFRNLKYADAYTVERLWLAPNRWSLCIRSKRIYFEQNRDLIDNRQEYIICNDIKPPNQPPASYQIKSQYQLLRCLMEANANYKANFVEVEEINLESAAVEFISIKDRQINISDQRLSKIYNEYGFDHVPNNFVVYICSLEGTPDKIIKIIADKLTKAFSQKNVSCVIKITSKEIILKHLTEINKKNKRIKSGFLFFFILPCRDKKVLPDTLDLFDLLEELGAPFRRAYSDDPLDYSIPDQLPSMLMAVGGKPHLSPLESDGAPIWTVGLDMGHSATERYTNLALTLVDPKGILIKTWLAKQDLDETIEPDLLAKMLRYCREEVLKFDNKPSLVLLRDGRYFKNDEINFCKDIFEGKISIFEYRKRGNPQIFKLDKNDEPIFFNGPFAVIIPGTYTIFLIPQKKQSMESLPKIAKVTWKANWNGLKLKPIDIAKLIIKSAQAPGLGLRSRLLPACIYWADGIATTSVTDLRFRGQRICKI